MIFVVNSLFRMALIVSYRNFLEYMIQTWIEN